MSKKKKLKSKVKRLEKTVDEVTVLAREAERELRKLKKKIALKNQRISELKDKLANRKKDGRKSVEEDFLDDNERRQLAVEHKNAWKRHTYLGECYDQYLKEGYDKERAREMANQDLMGRYGQDVGFSTEDLEVILS